MIVATPHLRRDFPNVHVERIAADCAQLRTAIPVEWELELVSGAEVDRVWALRFRQPAHRVLRFSHGLNRNAEPTTCPPPQRRAARLRDDGSRHHTSTCSSKIDNDPSQSEVGATSSRRAVALRAR